MNELTVEEIQRMGKKLIEEMGDDLYDYDYKEVCHEYSLPDDKPKAKKFKSKKTS